MSLKSLNIDDSWALFLDRDGVINKRIIDDYIKKVNEFHFLPGVLGAMPVFSNLFGKVFVVTNQQGIGKGLMHESDLVAIHDFMLTEVKAHGGHLHKIYHSPYRAEENSVFRKPGPGLARKAKIDFPDIDLEKAIMVGDSISDMQFGRNTGMKTVFIAPDKKQYLENPDLIDYLYKDLKAFAKAL